MALRQNGSERLTRHIVRGAQRDRCLEAQIGPAALVLHHVVQRALQRRRVRDALVTQTIAHSAGGLHAALEVGFLTQHFGQLLCARDLERVEHGRVI